MKLKATILIALFSISFLHAQTEPKDSTYIEGFLEGQKSGIARLVGVYGDQNYLADSVMVDEKGHFILKRKSPLKAGFYTLLLPALKNISFLIDTDDQIMQLNARLPDYTATMEVEGSLNTQMLYETNRFQVQQEPELNKLAETMRKFPPGSPEHTEAKAQQTKLIDERTAYLDGIYKRYPDLFFTKFKYAGQNPEFVEMRKPNGDIDTVGQLVAYREKMWDNVDFNDERLLYTPVISNKLKRYIKDLTPQRPDSIIKVSDALIRKVIPYPEYFKFFANWIALQYENTKTTVMDGEAVFVHVVQNFFTDELAFWDKPENLAALRKHVWEMEASLLGKKGPDVTASDMNGQPHSIYEKTAPIIVIFMYSPDCEHCQKEAAEIEAIYRKWKDKGVDFYGIAVNTNTEDWKQFSKEKGFTFTNVYDPSNRAIYAKYFVDITPELYVLNKDRILIAKNLHANQLEEVFERELKKLK